MDYELNFGKRRRRRSPKKLSKKQLDTLTVKKLRTLARKYKVSIYKKRSKSFVKKSTLLSRLKKSRSINKILRSLKKSSYRSRFGNTNVLGPGQPSLKTPIELVTGRTYKNLEDHYRKLPLSFLSGNFPPNVRYSGASYGKDSSFGNTNVLGPGKPSLKTPIELVTGRTYNNLKQHYLNTPLSFLSGNFPPNVTYSGAAYGKDSSFGKKRNSRNNFGQYFR